MQDNVKKYLVIENERRENKQKEKDARQRAMEYEYKCANQFRENHGKKDEWDIPVRDITVSKDMLKPESIYYSYNGEKEFYDAYFFTDRVIVNGKVVIEGEVETIPAASFKGCCLEDLIIEEGVKGIAGGVCKQYEDKRTDIRCSERGCRIECKKGQESRKHCGAFCRCSRLKQVTVPRSLEYIGSDAFRRCNRLASVNGLRDSHVTIIRDDAFAVCSRIHPDRAAVPFCVSGLCGTGKNYFCCAKIAPNLNHVLTERTVNARS